jgi:hypothetical protein
MHLPQPPQSYDPTDQAQMRRILELEDKKNRKVLLNAAGKEVDTFAAIADKELLANISGASAPAIGTALSAYLDAAIGSVAQGDLLYRGAASWSRLPAGTAGQFLKTSGAGANPAWDTPGGGSGSVNASSLYPAFTTPVNANFSWVNQGGASVIINANGGIFLRAPTSAGNNIRMRKMAAPGSTPYTIDAAFFPAVLANSFLNCGVAIRDSSSGKILLYQCAGSANLEQFACQRFTNETTFSADAMTAVNHGGWPLTFMRVKDDGVNRIFSFSFDGYSYIQLLSEARTTFLTANEIGFYANTVNASFEGGITLMSWKVT